MKNAFPTPDDHNPLRAKLGATLSALPHTQAGLPGKFPPLDAGFPALFARLERQLRSGKTPLATMAVALATIKSQGLTRLHGLSFQEYCDQHLRLKKSRIHQLLEFADLLEVTTGSGSLPRADNERQLRPLKRVPREEWLAAWGEAVRTAPAGKLTGKHVAAIVDACLARKHAAESPAAPPASGPSPEAATTSPVPSPIESPILPATSTTPSPRAYPAEFVRTVPAPGIALPGWKPEWAKIICEAPRPPASLRSGVFGWQPPD